MFQILIPLKVNASSSINMKMSEVCNKSIFDFFSERHKKHKSNLINDGDKVNGKTCKTVHDPVNHDEHVDLIFALVNRISIPMFVGQMSETLKTITKQNKKLTAQLEVKHQQTLFIVIIVKFTLRVQIIHMNHRTFNVLKKQTNNDYKEILWLYALGKNYRKINTWFLI